MCNNDIDWLPDHWKAEQVSHFIDMLYNLAAAIESTYFAQLEAYEMKQMKKGGYKNPTKPKLTTDSTKDDMPF